jgi:hypothetical protein
VNIEKYMKEHEAYVVQKLVSEQEGTDWDGLKEKHRRVTADMQHERLIHLMVTLSFGVFLLVAVAIASVRPTIAVGVLAGLFLIMLIPYVAHYFFLENRIQRWYRLMDDIDKKCAEGGGDEG